MEIVKRCKLGEKEAFQELFSAIEKDALATAYLISGHRGISEDILQETYIKCFKEIKYLKSAEAFKVWFFRILVRTGWEMCKKHSSLIPVDITDEKEISFYNIKNTTENAFDNLETKEIIKSAVNNLSPNLKTVIILYYFNDMTIEEISKVLGCLKATVKSRLFYGRTALKKELGRYFTDETDFSAVDRKECNESV